MNTGVIYYGIFIDEESRNKLRQLVPAEAFKVYCDHMTLAHSSGFNEEIVNMCESLLGKEFTLVATTLGRSNDAMAVGIETDCPSVNTHKHITLCTMTPQSKPVQSNYIQDWRKLKTPITLKGKVMAFTKNGLMENNMVKNSINDMNIIKLTEQDIHRIVKETVNRIINEEEDGRYGTYNQYAYLKLLLGDKYKPEYDYLPYDKLRKMIEWAKRKKDDARRETFTYYIVDEAGDKFNSYGVLGYSKAKKELDKIVKSYVDKGFDVSKWNDHEYYVVGRGDVRLVCYYSPEYIATGMV